MLRIKQGLAATSRMKSVTAPSMKKSSVRFAAKPTSSLVDTGDPARFICPLFESPRSRCRALRGAAPGPRITASAGWTPPRG